MVNDDENGVDVDIVVNYNPAANIVGPSNTAKDGDIPPESSSEVAPPVPQDVPPSEGNEGSESLAEKLLPAKKSNKKTKS